MRDEDRAAILFDLGLGTLQVDACVRSSDAAFIAALRRWVGQSLFAPGNGAMRRDSDGKPASGFSQPYRARRGVSADPAAGRKKSRGSTHPRPPQTIAPSSHPCGYGNSPGRIEIPCAHFYPPHPMRDAFGHRQPFRSERHAAFQTLLARYGDPQLVDIKRRVVAPSSPDTGRPTQDSCRAFHAGCCPRGAAAVEGSRTQFTGTGGLALGP